MARRPGEYAMKTLFLICGLTAVAFVLLITGYLVLSGLPAIREIGLADFLLGDTWDAANPEAPRFGILPLLLTSVYGAAGATAIGVPLGFLTALFLAKAAPPWLARLVRPAVGVLAGIPSVVYGLVGMCVLLPLLRERLGLPAGDSLLAAILMLAVLILPTVISVSETALEAVPREIEVTAPAAGSGVAAAVALGVGRAIGEAMAILMVAGNVANMPALLGSVRFLTTGIAMELAYAPAGSLQQQALLSIGLVLFLFVLLVNVLLSLALKRGREGD